MTFKKIDVDEIKFSMYENLIGLPYVDKKEEEKYEDKQLGLSKSFKSSKKEGLTIPITFRRTELFEGNIKGDISGNLSEDSLIIRNISDRDKLWNLKVNLEEISKNIFITEIPPSQEWTQKIKESKEGFAPKLKVYEKISRKDYISDLGEESQLFLEKNGENEIYGNIVLHNKSKDRLTDIVLTKYFPRTLLELLEVKHNSGTVDKNIKRLKWTISNLNPEKELSLRYKIKLSPKPTQSGKIDIQYRVNVGGNDLYNIDDFDSSIKVAEFVHINEKDEKPGFWDCSLTLINRSSYKVNLIGAELTQDTDEGTERHFSLKNSDISIKPYEEKTLFSKTIESEN